jgi:predicted DNA-binding protein YlxM (UPF0122 family)
MAKDLQISFLLDFYGDMLTEKQREMITLYYNDDLSLAEIAEDQGITRQGVRDAIKRAEQQLTDMEACLGLARRFGEMREGLSKICDETLKIAEFNRQYVLSDEIEESVARIMQLANELSED